MPVNPQADDSQPAPSQTTPGRRSLARSAKLLRFRARAAVRRGRRWLLKRPRVRTFIKNLALGCAIAIAVIVLENRGLLAGLQHALLDWQIASVKATSSGANIAFIDIDEASEATFAEGGVAPYFTPRDKLEQLIAAAVRAEASVVVVDIDVSQPPGPGSYADAWREINGPAAPSGAIAVQQRRHHAMLEQIPAPRNLAPAQRFYVGNWELSRYLARHARACASQPVNVCVPIVLARTVRVAPGSGAFAPVRESMLERIHTYLFGETTAPTERRALPSFVDADLTRSPGVLWGSVTFDRDDDYVIRRWRLWEPVCTSPSGGVALPSSALLAFALYRSRHGAEPPFDDGVFETDLTRSFAPAACDPEQALPAERVAQPPRPLYGVYFRLQDRPRTLRYRISWDGGETSLASVIPAALLTSARPGDRLKIDCERPGASPYCVRGKIVVIGSTYRDNGDYHRVPGGELPGSIVLINMIDSLVQQDHDFDDVPKLYGLLLEFVLIVLLSLAFLKFENETAVLFVASLALLALCLPLSFVILLRLNLWFDITAPLVGIVLHEAKVLADRARSDRKASTP